jgi:2-dehydropantoate 2-reductase
VSHRKRPLAIAIVEIAPMPDSPHIAILGAGAVGCYFGGMLARSGARVTLIGRTHHIDAIRRDGLFFDSIHYRGRVDVEASTDPAAVDRAGFVLLCVKTLDTVSAIEEAAPHLAAGAAVVSLQNGVDNADRIRAALGIDAIPAVVWVAAEMTAPGRLKHNGRGDLVLPDRPDTASLARLFEQAGVPCRLSANIAAELWTKMIINCTYNAISALARARYGAMASDPIIGDLMRRVIDECLAVAGVLGVKLDAAQVTEAARRLGDAMKDATSSTAQDIARGKLTEIDSLNGYVVRRAAELGIAVPVNQTLHGLVKLLECAAVHYQA